MQLINLFNKALIQDAVKLRRVQFLGRHKRRFCDGKLSDSKGPLEEIPQNSPSKHKTNVDDDDDKATLVEY